MALWIFTLTVALLRCPVARADDAAQAAQLFDEGRQAMRANDFAAACTKFQLSHQLSSAIGTLLNLAICEEALGHWLEAQQKYLEVLRELKPDDARLPIAKAKALDLEQRVPHLTLILPGDAPSDTVIADQDGKVVASRQRMILDPGTHALTVRASGFKDAIWPIEINASDDKVVALRLGPALTPATPAPFKKVPEPEGAPQRPAALLRIQAPSPHAPPADTAQRNLGWMLLGIGSGALVLSGVSTGFVFSYKHQVERECDSSGCSPRGLSADGSGAAWSALGTASALTAVVAGGTGAWFLIQPGLLSGEASRTMPAASLQKQSRKRPTIALGASREGAVLSLRGEF